MTLFIDYGDDWPPPPPPARPSRLSRARRIGRALRPYGERVLIWVVVYAVLSGVLAVRPRAPFDPSKPDRSTSSAVTPPAPACSITDPCEKDARRNALDSTSP